MPLDVLHGVLSGRFHYHKNASFYTHLFSLFPVLWKMATTVMEEKFLNEEKESYEPTSCFCQGKLLFPGLLCTVYYSNFILNTVFLFRLLHCIKGKFIIEFIWYWWFDWKIECCTYFRKIYLQTINPQEVIGISNYST